MTFASTHEHVTRPMSSRIRHLRRAAAEARADAELVIKKQSGRAAAGSSAFARTAGWAASKVVGSVASTVARHPVSALLIASVVAGTVWYHRAPRARGR
jgi:hypothetical protein